MNWLAFIAAVIQALAWPLVVLALGLVFRTQIRALLGRPSGQLEAGPFKASWQTILAEVSTELPKPSSRSAKVTVGEPRVTTLKTLVRTDPAEAVFVAHDIVVRQLQAMTGQEYGPPPLPATAASLARVARERGLISEETLRAIEGFTRLRNLAAHSGPDKVSSDQAGQYVAQMEAILGVLEEPPKDSPSGGG